MYNPSSPNSVNFTFEDIHTASINTIVTSFVPVIDFGMYHIVLYNIDLVVRLCLTFLVHISVDCVQKKHDSHK